MHPSPLSIGMYDAEAFCPAKDPFSLVFRWPIHILRIVISKIIGLWQMTYGPDDVLNSFLSLTFENVRWLTEQQLSKLRTLTLICTDGKLNNNGKHLLNLIQCCNRVYKQKIPQKDKIHVDKLLNALSEEQSRYVLGEGDLNEKFCTFNRKNISLLNGEGLNDIKKVKIVGPEGLNQNGEHLLELMLSAESEQGEKEKANLEKFRKALSDEQLRCLFLNSCDLSKELLSLSLGDFSLLGREQIKKLQQLPLADQDNELNENGRYLKKIMAPILPSGKENENITAIFKGILSRDQYKRLCLKRLTLQTSSEAPAKSSKEKENKLTVEQVLAEFNKSGSLRESSLNVLQCADLYFVLSELVKEKERKANQEANLEGRKDLVTAVVLRIHSKITHSTKERALKLFNEKYKDSEKPIEKTSAQRTSPQAIASRCLEHRRFSIQRDRLLEFSDDGLPGLREKLAVWLRSMIKQKVIVIDEQAVLSPPSNGTIEHSQVSNEVAKEEELAKYAQEAELTKKMDACIERFLKESLEDLEKYQSEAVKSEAQNFKDQIHSDDPVNFSILLHAMRCCKQKELCHFRDVIISLIKTNLEQARGEKRNVLVQELVKVLTSMAMSVHTERDLLSREQFSQLLPYLDFIQIYNLIKFYKKDESVLQMFIENFLQNWEGFCKQIAACNIVELSNYFDAYCSSTIEVYQVDTAYNLQHSPTEKADSRLALFRDEVVKAARALYEKNKGIVFPSKKLEEEILPVTLSIQTEVPLIQPDMKGSPPDWGPA